MDEPAGSRSRLSLEMENEAMTEIEGAVSTGDCNSPGEDFTWFHPSEGLSRTTIELSSDGIEVIL